MKIILTSLLALVLNQAAFTGEVSSEEEQTYPIKSGSSVILNSDDGSIRVNGWDKQEVHLKITKRVWHPDKERAEELLDELEIDISHTKDSVADQRKGFEA